MTLHMIQYLCNVSNTILVIQYLYNITYTIQVLLLDEMRRIGVVDKYRRMLGADDE